MATKRQEKANKDKEMKGNDERWKITLKVYLHL